MQKVNLLNQAQSIASKILSKDILQKVEFSILNYVYSQIIAALSSSLFCATIIVIGLYGSHQTKQLSLWVIFCLIVTAVRLVLFVMYKFDSSYHERIAFWRNAYVVGSLFGGASWGLAGMMLLPDVDPAQQMLLVLMLAGVTAGAVQLSAAVPTAAIMFLIFSILPFIVTIMTTQTHILHLFNISLSLYLIYSIFLVIRSYRLTKSSIILTFENETLLDDLESVNIMLQQAATHDPLTKVANRRLFTTTLNKLIIQTRMNNQKLSLLFFDLDHFKKMNDVYGHEAGDQILLTVIDRLREYFRKDDIISRLGGDEFAVVIENIKSHADVASIAQKICQLISKPIKWKDIELNVSTSVGVAIYPHDGSNEEDLLRCADKCMYFVKDQGGNNYCFSDQLKTTV